VTIAAIRSFTCRSSTCASCAGIQYERSSGIGERHCMPIASRSISVTRSSAIQDD
jgi:hypothetical protein